MVTFGCKGLGHVVILSTGLVFYWKPGFLFSFPTHSHQSFLIYVVLIYGNPGSHTLPTLQIISISEAAHGRRGGRFSMQGSPVLSGGSNPALPTASPLCSAICVTRHSWMPPFSGATSSAGMQARQKSVSRGSIWELLDWDLVSGAHTHEPAREQEGSDRFHCSFFLSMMWQWSALCLWIFVPFHVPEADSDSEWPLVSWPHLKPSEAGFGHKWGKWAVRPVLWPFCVLELIMT